MKFTNYYLMLMTAIVSCDNRHSQNLPSGGDKHTTVTEREGQALKQNLSTQNGNSLIIQTKNVSKGWTPEERNTFMTACVEGITEDRRANSDNFCACLQNKLEKLYPVADDVINLPEQKQAELFSECQQ